MIKLNEEVMVSDPCYSIGTWCQHKLKNVLPGEYKTFTLEIQEYGTRISVLQAIHKDYLDTDLKWRQESDQIGVDSGQAGIFSIESYRNDEVEIERPVLSQDFCLTKDEPGDTWYESMCHFTLGQKHWGEYSEGVVSSSGFGDGQYSCKVAKVNKKIVGITLDFGLHKLNNTFINDIQYFKQHDN
jgi:hypothetical protein